MEEGHAPGEQSGAQGKQKGRTRSGRRNKSTTPNVNLTGLQKETEDEGTRAHVGEQRAGGEERKHMREGGGGERGAQRNAKSIDKKQKEKQIDKTQGKLQWIVAQRLLSALTIPGFR